MKLIPIIKADTYRQLRKSSLFNILTGFIKYRTLRPIISLRLCQFFQSKRFSSKIALLFCKIMHHYNSHNAMLDLPWQTSIGGGLLIVHGWGLVVNKHAVIGKNVTLLHGVTIGRRDKIDNNGTRSTEFPTIEDNVWIGPHAIIVGGITIGNGSIIGGGAFVNETVPPNSVVSGNPSKIIKTGCTPDVLNPVKCDY